MSHQGNGAERELTHAEAIFETLDYILSTTPESIVIGGAWAGVVRDRDPGWRRLAEAFADRIHYPPIAELAVCGIGTGAAMGGLRPLVNLGMASYAFQGWPQLVNEAANIHYMTEGRSRAPMVLHFFSGGRPGSAAQHTHHPEASLWNVPGLEIVLPSGPREVAGLLLSAAESDNPTVFVNHLGLLDERALVPEHPFRIPLGKAGVVRAGADVSIVAVSIAVREAVLAAAELVGDGIDAEVIDVRTLVPFDRETICASAARTGRVIVVEGGQLTSGIGAEIAAVIGSECFGQLLAPIRRIAVPDCPIPASPVLKGQLEPSCRDIAAAARAVVQEGNR